MHAPLSERVKSHLLFFMAKVVGPYPALLYPHMMGFQPLIHSRDYKYIFFFTGSEWKCHVELSLVASVEKVITRFILSKERKWFSLLAVTGVRA